MGMNRFKGKPLWLAESSGETVVADPILWIHILAGAIALFAGVAAIVTTKGGSGHNRAGKLYVAAMAVVVVTAFPLLVWADNWFLFAISVFTGYPIAAGYRTVRCRRSGATRPKPHDYVLHGTMLLTGVAMAAVGAYGSVTDVLDLGSVLAVFGSIGAGLAVRKLHQFRVPPPEASVVVRAPHRVYGWWLHRDSDGDDYGQSHDGTAAPPVVRADARRGAVDILCDRELQTAFRWDGSLIGTDLR